MEKPILKSYNKGTFFEFLIHNNPTDSIILLQGFPSSNNSDQLMRFLHEKGFNVFHLRYKGSFQSEGNFLETNPVNDIIETINHIKKGNITNLWDMKEHSIESKKFIILTGSFSGAIACGIVTKSNLISKLILTAPVWDFNEHNTIYKEQDLSHLLDFVKRAYKNLYRIKFNNLITQLNRFEELIPDNYIDKLKCPLLVLHDPKDKVVSINHTKQMVGNIKNSKLIKHNLGHSLSEKLIKTYWNEISDFVNTK